MKPVYKKIEAELRSRINSDFYTVSSWLPSERQLASEFKVAVSTIRRALYCLIKENIIIAVQGKGYQLIKKTNYKNQPLTGFYRVMEQYGQNGTINKVTKFSTKIADKNVAKILKIGPEDLVYDIERLRILNQLPILLEYSYLPVKLFPTLTVMHMEQSKFKFIQNECNIIIYDGYRVFTPHLADQYQAELLHVALNHPLLKLTTTIFTFEGLPIEISEQLIVPERYNSQHYFKAT
ncbi:GntR family transcriptional regulator [Orbus sturtevantii]|uniref:GntR family transcriptional regulator n=1 Tax=Orbus sturtevantii TaxID=3074109 RepID=UPI00370D76EB